MPSPLLSLLVVPTRLLAMSGRSAVDAPLGIPALADLARAPEAVATVVRRTGLVAAVVAASSLGLVGGGEVVYPKGRPGSPVPEGEPLPDAA